MSVKCRCLHLHHEDTSHLPRENALLDHVRNDTLREEAGVRDMETVLRRKRIEWYGHMQTKKQNDIYKYITSYMQLKEP